jgi:hypothetical protein
VRLFIHGVADKDSNVKRERIRTGSSSRLNGAPGGTGRTGLPQSPRQHHSDDRDGPNKVSDAAIDALRANPLQADAIDARTGAR